MEEEKRVEEINPLDYVTIPVKEYRKLIKKIERMKAENAALVKIGEVKEKAEDYRRWWHEEKEKTENLEKLLADAKAQIKELLGIEEEGGKA